MIVLFQKEAKFSLVILHAPKETMPAVISRINESEPQFLYLTENFEYQPSHQPPILNHIKQTAKG